MPSDKFQIADLPPKDKSFWQLVGPGAILVGLAIGSGELIMWPRMTAKFGAGMTWAAMLGVLAQLWVNFELGRYTIATGESVYAGFARISRFLSYLFFALVIFTTILPAWAVVSGCALKALLVGLNGWGPTWFWTWLTFGFILLLLLGPKYIYRTFERAEIILVLLVTLGLIVVVVQVCNLNTWQEVGSGVVNIGWLAPDAKISDVFAALVFAGIGGTGNIFLCFYLRDKNIGMGARAPHIFNPLRGKIEKVPCQGYTFQPTQENLSNWKKWFNHFKTDQVLFFWFLNTFTIVLFILASYAVLHPRGLVPDGLAIATTQATILKEVMGRVGEIIFLIVAFASLFSTQLGIIDGNARSLSDILYTNSARCQAQGLSWLYLVIVVCWVLVGAILSLFQFPPWTMFVTSSCLGGLAMAIYCPLMLYLNHRYLPREIRPGLLHTAMLVLVSLIYIIFVVYLAVDLVR